MTDIVKRLRKITSADMAFYQIDAERREAADELERLRAEVKMLLFEMGEENRKRVIAEIRQEKSDD